MSLTIMAIITSTWGIYIHNMVVLAIIYQIEIIGLFLYTIFLGGVAKNSIQKFFLIYLLVTNIIEITSLFGRNYFNLTTNGILYNLYSLFCLCFFYLLYAASFSGKSRNIFLGVFIIVFVYIGVFTDFLKFEYDYRIGAALALFYMWCALFWMGYKILNVDNKMIMDHSKFWISVGLILWSSFFIFRSIPMYLFEKIDDEFQTWLRKIFYVVNIVFYILFFIAVQKSKKISTENERSSL